MIETDDAGSMPAFFTAAEDGFAPGRRACGYWATDTVQGAAVIGLFGYELEHMHTEAERRPVRLSVELFRPVPLSVARIETSTVRDGSRLKLVEARYLAGDVTMARATCQFVRPSVSPPDPIWQPAPWSAPPASALPPEDTGWGDTLVDLRTIDGKIGESGPKKLWTRARFTVVEDVALTPFVRAALLADFASPLSHASGRASSYINTDAALSMHRLPDGEWIGFETIGRESSDGIALGQCRLHDDHGPFGYVSTTAMANARKL